MQTMSEDSVGAAGHRVLVVDDDAYLRLLLALEIPDLVILEASRTEEGYELAMSERPDVVVVDRRLPDGDGLDLVRRLRANAAMRRTPIIVVTAGHDESLRYGVLRAGADDYLSKPINPEELRARIQQILELPPDERRQRRKQEAERALQESDAERPSPSAPEPKPFVPPDATEPPPAPTTPAVEADDDQRGGLFRRRRRG